MVKERMTCWGILRKRGADGDVDFLREALVVLVEGIMDAEVSARTGAGYSERSTERVTHRNGYRSRQWDSRMGTMDLRIPRLREGSYFPSLLKPQRRRIHRSIYFNSHLVVAALERTSSLNCESAIVLGCELANSKLQNCHKRFQSLRVSLVAQNLSKALGA